MTKKTYTAEEVHKKYKDKYINITCSFNYDTLKYNYTINKVSSTIKENMTLGQDVGTDLAYRR